MGSELFLKSGINEGSKFYFTLTLPPADKEVISDRRGEHRNVLHLASECKVKALVVDDVKENREVLAKLLLSIGVEVFEANDGKEGVKKTKEHHPDIIFMDMRMPVMRGEDAVKLILEEFGENQIKIVAITASALDRRREFYLDMGCHEFISKPFTAEQIYSCLDKLLDVEFEYEQEEFTKQESSSATELDYSKIFLPEDLLLQIKKAAELYNISEMERALITLQSMDGGCNQLAIQIEELLNRYDMEGITKIVEKLNHVEN